MRLKNLRINVDKPETKNMTVIDFRGLRLNYVDSSCMPVNVNKYFAKNKFFN